ncbi:hypothetical protein C8J57DRAFT_1506626 [Mycena rebaudengoi]|nr:hypothetical protein C8J57DRAFT_1506626 [Mycena rebaudengoi]
MTGTNKTEDTQAPSWPTRNERGYDIPDLPYGTLRPIKVIGIGAEMSGISLAHDVQEDGKNIELTIYGRTWFWNKYPGLRCGIPSVNYQMHWSPKLDWPEYYSQRSVFQEYYRSLVDKFNLWKYINLQHKVVRAEWDDAAKKWRIKVRGPNGREFEDECDVLLNGGGVLNVWKWPDIEGLHSFKGDLCHSARWPDDLVVKDKRVAVIGCGSSGIQVLPAIQPEVKRLFHWIRSPTWITAAFAPQFAGPGGVNFQYSEEQKKRFIEDPKHALKYKKMIEVR